MQSPVDANTTAALTDVMTWLGFGTDVSHVLALITLMLALSGAVGQIMPFLKVASASSATWYKNVFGLVARITGSWGRNAPMPPPGAQPAGGIVPVPPALKPGA